MAGTLPTILDMVETVALTGPKASSLPWWSGMACPNAGAAGAWRGQPLDTGWAGIGKRTWSSAISGAKSASLRKAAQATSQPVIHLHLLPKEADGQLATCAAGAFDQKFRDIGTALKNNGAGHAVIRLGKEANRGRSAYGYTSYSQKDSYIGCFQHASAALKAGSSELKIEWTNGRKTLNPVNPAEFYPGDQAVDIIGVHYYDNPELGRMTTQEIWDRLYVQNNPGGGPQGAGLWLALAKSKDKPLSISEWGIWGREDPFYIEKMFQFFKTNAADLAYESYFNCADHHQIYPVAKFPITSAKYKELWSKG